MRLSRLVGALIALGLLALAVAALWDNRAPGFALLGPALAVTPMVIFCASILNGSALEITGGLAFIACLLRIARDGAAAGDGCGRAPASSGVILALSRSAGPVTIVLALLTLLALLGPRDAWHKLKEGGRPALVATIAVVIGLVGNRVWEAAYGPDVRFSLTAARLGLETALEEFPSWLEEMVGKFGYLEFDLPLLLYIFWGLATFAAVALALRSTSGRERAVLIGCVIALAVIPIVQYVVFQRHTGFGLQGRHVLPFLVVIPLLAGELLRRREELLRAPRARLLLTLCFAGVALAQFAALYLNGRRSAVGVDGSLLFLGDAEWSPPIGWGLWLAVAALGAACIAVAGAQAARALAPEAEASQEQQRRLAQAAAARQQPELDAGVVEVEEAARALHAPVAELDEVDAVEGDEAVAAGQGAELSPVGTGGAPRHARVVLVADPRSGSLDLQVGECVEQHPGVGLERPEPRDGLARSWILVVDVDRADRREPAGDPRLHPAVGQGVRRQRLELPGPHVSSGTPSTGLEASA